MTLHLMPLRLRRFRPPLASSSAVASPAARLLLSQPDEILRLDARCLESGTDERRARQQDAPDASTRSKQTTHADTDPRQRCATHTANTKHISDATRQAQSGERCSGRERGDRLCRSAMVVEDGVTAAVSLLCRCSSRRWSHHAAPSTDSPMARPIPMAP